MLEPITMMHSSSHTCSPAQEHMRWHDFSTCNKYNSEGIIWKIVRITQETRQKTWCGGVTVYMNTFLKIQNKARIKNPVREACTPCDTSNDTSLTLADVDNMVTQLTKSTKPYRKKNNYRANHSSLNDQANINWSSF
jgi:hypothetical protein